LSRQSSEYLRLAREAKEQALRYDAEMHALMLSIADAYELLARVQDAIDDPDAVDLAPQSEPERS
jgi:hypothetical protein